MVQSKKTRMNKTGDVNVKNAEKPNAHDEEYLLFLDYIKTLKEETVSNSLHWLNFICPQSQKQPHEQQPK